MRPNLDAGRRPPLEKCCMLDWSLEFPAGELKTANVNIDPCCAGAEQQLQNKHTQQLLLVYNKPLGVCAVTFGHGKNYFLIQYFCLVFQYEYLWKLVSATE